MTTSPPWWSALIETGPVHSTVSDVAPILNRRACGEPGASSASITLLKGWAKLTVSGPEYEKSTHTPDGVTAATAAWASISP
jgi:hypothetical protein